MNTSRKRTISVSVIIVSLLLILAAFAFVGCSAEEDCQAAGYTCATTDDCCDGLTCQQRPFSSFYSCE